MYSGSGIFIFGSRMGLEDKLHQKMVSIVLGGVAKIDQAPKKTLFSGVRDALCMRWQRIRAFFRS